MRDSSAEAETMRVVLLLCSAFALSVTTADPVKKMKPEPVEDPLPVQQNKTADEKRGELLRRITGMGTKWQGTVLPPDYFPGENNCPFHWHSYRGRCFSFINIPMAWMEAEKHCWHYGANLASIHDEQEHNFIRDFVMDSNYYGLYGPAWIGGHDAVRSGEWLWSDGSVFDVGSWATLMPSIWNRWNKCLSMGLADTRYCEEMFPFVCGTRPDLMLLM
ncbi:ladderlectin-like isoform X1 [Seriola dumerili]|uniref:ladderlectin-like isoform X1 n=1 Tax=Seriola dumerili TaxID=41447 RepID=UPI000BBE2455|nr:ladderlectin-like isoform X1 [Seriola dumerili]